MLLRPLHLAALALLLTSASARAADGDAAPASATAGSGAAPLAPRGRFLFSVERAFAWGGDQRVEQSAPMPAGRESTDEWSSGWRGITSFDAPASTLAVRAPRVAMDLVVARRFTVGATALVWPGGGDASVGYVSSHQSAWAYGVAPRVGWVVPTGESSFFWLRLAIPASYTVSSYDASWFNKGTSGSEGFHALLHYVGVGATLSPSFVVAASRAISFAFAVDLDANVGSRWTSAPYTGGPTATPFKTLGMLGSVGVVVTP